MIGFDLKGIKASSMLFDYIEKIHANKRWEDWKKMLFVYLQLNRLESDNFKAKEIILEREALILNQGIELRKVQANLLKVEAELAQRNEENKEFEKTIELLSDGMIARCDLCGSDKPINQ